MNKSEHIPYELLGKYFSGEASPEEAIAVEDWIAAAPEHRRLFEQTAGLWENAAGGQQHTLPDKAAVWQEIRRQLPGAAPLKTAAVRPGNRRLMAAAILLLICGASLYFLLYRTSAPAADWVSRQTTAGIFRDTLPDHSLAVINSHSAISYEKGLAGRNRLIRLKGQAWFDVTFNPGKPFIVEVGDIAVKVLGTAFNIQQKDSTIEVAVLNGSVAMMNSRNRLTVTAGQQGIYHAASGTFELVNAFNSNKMGYATRVFNFENTSLKDIAAQLEKAYGVTIRIADKKLENCAMSSSFENKPLDYIFEVISVTLNVQCRVEKDSVYINGEGCN
ncbi:FecR domain-containing protein [Chitinophaga solisilvae]|uniref:FecR domain-containing protein n=1 Tax=Chitinophaga solisilvae TaxID=1233460 RepID=UPI00137063D7|nr:FecR domain-containing protein [Chitinophaga solisilvae]